MVTDVAQGLRATRQTADVTSPTLSAVWLDRSRVCFLQCPGFSRTSRIRVAILKSSRRNFLSFKATTFEKPSKGLVVKTCPLPANSNFCIICSHVFTFHLSKEGWQGARIFLHRREQTRGGRKDRSAACLVFGRDQFDSARSLAQNDRDFRRWSSQAQDRGFVH